MQIKDKIEFRYFLKNEYNLSERAINILLSAELNSLSAILKYFLHYKTFIEIRNCGITANEELVTFCNSINGKINFLDDEINNELNIFKDKIEFRYFLKNEYNLSERAINILLSAQLNSLSAILKHFLFYKTFIEIRNCGISANEELVTFCNSFNSKIKFLDDEINNELDIEKKRKNLFTDKIESFNLEQRATLNNFFKYSLSKLKNEYIRSYNGLKSISINLDSKIILPVILKDNFNFYSIKNLGEKSVEILNDFKTKIIEFINYVDLVESKGIFIEYSKSKIKNSFTNDLPKEFDKVFSSFYFENRKLKIFSLLKYLINSTTIFNSVEFEIFKYLYQVSNNDDDFLSKISLKVNLSRERVRQKRVEFENNFFEIFNFINFTTDELFDYGLEINKDLIQINDYLKNRINENENTNFNVNFISKIYSIINFETHSLLSNNMVIFGERKKINQRKFTNNYLISNKIYSTFNFYDFLIDVSQKELEKRTEDLELNFNGYIYEFLINGNTEPIHEIIEICKIIILNEFDLVLSNSGYLTFPKNSAKLIFEYALEILIENQRLMHFEEIIGELKLKYPDYEFSENSLKTSIQRENEIFIFIGRSSTYGLKIWEYENNNLRGGTIRDLVEDYLLTQDTPKHISEIVEYVLQYRPDTNEKSVLSNIKLDESKKFHFFKKAIVGLASKKYNEKNLKEIENSKSWNDKFIELKGFRKVNINKWPSVTSSDKNERALYMMCYKARKSFQKGDLDKEREELLRSIGFPIDEQITRANDWKTEVKKLINFWIAKKKWPSAISSNKEERALYRFCYLNKKAFQKNELSNEQIEILKKMNFNFKILK